MENLITITMDENLEPLVSGRELHEKLEVKTPYKKWFDRMIEYGFAENVDFSVLDKNVQDDTAFGGERIITEHVMTLDMAKQIAMIQRSDIGKKIRQYFIDVEKEYNNPDMVMKRALVIADNRIKALQLENKMQEQQIHELKPKADYTDKILQSKKLVTITQIAKDYGMSGRKMNSILHDLKVQYKQSNQWLLYSQHQDKGYTHSETTYIEKANGSEEAIMNTKWTQKGRLFLYELLKKNGIYPIVERR